jgi:hypothetical protein
MASPAPRQDELDSEVYAFYDQSLRTLQRAGVPFLVGGAYAFARYTGIHRHTKDFDVFVRREDCNRALDVLTGSGCQTELTFPHWLGKAFCGDNFIDVIFGAGNGVAEVDELWFERAVEDNVLGHPVKLVPAEEMIWSKAFIMERERFDGADLAHMFRAVAEDLDWKHLVFRFGPHWRVLFAHLVLFGFIYPTERNRIPAGVMRYLLDRLRREIAEAPAEERICQGTLLSRAQYLVDVSEWDYLDARLLPRGSMTIEETERWTAAIEEQKD